MTVPFYAYQQGPNRLSAQRWSPEPHDIVVGVPPYIPDKGIQVRLGHQPTEESLSVVLPINEAVSMALGILTEVGTMAAQQVAKVFEDFNLDQLVPEEDKS